MASGSEVGVVLEARGILTGEGRRVRVVSMPSPDLFLRQDASWREKVLPAVASPSRPVCRWGPVDASRRLHSSGVSQRIP